MDERDEIASSGRREDGQGSAGDHNELADSVKGATEHSQRQIAIEIAGVLRTALFRRQTSMNSAEMSTFVI